MSRPDTIVHLLRHGEVHNPEGVLYGRRDGYHLSELGRQMAQRVADDASATATSSTSRPRRSSGPRRPRAPLAAARGLDDRHRRAGDRVDQRLRGQAVRRRRRRAAQARRPGAHLWNPFKPSWGEPYKEVVARMMAAVHDARDAARGHEAVIVSHQLPIWITRLHVEKRSFLHDPRKRQCTLCSLTSLHFDGDALRR